MLKPPAALRLATAGVLFSASTASAAILTLTPGAARTDDPLLNIQDWTLDAGLAVHSTPANPDRIIFEAGGDGLGSALAWIGNELIYYYDVGDWQTPTPTNDRFISLDISPFAGSIISIRLDADLTSPTDVMTLTATDGTTTLTNSVTLPTNGNGVAGGNDTGFGLTSQDLAGLDESTEAGFPNMAQFNAAGYKPGGDPALILGPDMLAGTLYTTTSNQAPAAIPDPSSWGLVIPEPGSAALVLLATAALGFRRRRA